VGVLARAKDAITIRARMRLDQSAPHREMVGTASERLSEGKIPAADGYGLVAAENCEEGEKAILSGSRKNEDGHRLRIRFISVLRLLVVLLSKTVVHTMFLGEFIHLVKQVHPFQDFFFSSGLWFGKAIFVRNECLYMGEPACSTSLCV
jgi:hypothetical protein